MRNSWGGTFLKNNISELGPAWLGQFIKNTAQEIILINVPPEEKKREILQLGNRGAAARASGARGGLSFLGRGLLPADHPASFFLVLLMYFGMQNCTVVACQVRLMEGDIL